MGIMYNREAVDDVTIKVTKVTLSNKYNGGEFTRTVSGVWDTVDCFATDIYNALQFYNIRYHDDDRFKLKADIDLSTLGERWAPIPELNGTLLGNVHGISGLDIFIPSTVTNSANYGLFAKINEDGVVGGVIINGGSITSDSIHGLNWINVGLLAGENHGSVSFNTVRGTVDCNRNRASIGGIVGSNYGTVGYNAFTGTVYGNGDMGGIVGSNRAGEVMYNGNVDSFVKHYVVDEAKSVGGIVGYCGGGTVSYSTVSRTSIAIVNTSTVKNITTCMGIVVGHLENATMENDNTIEECATSTGTLKNTNYCFKQYNGQIGKITNGTVV